MSMSNSDIGIAASPSGEALVYWDYGVGPRGACPTQGEGVIARTGQRVYFRYRGGRASLAISGDDRAVYSFRDPGAVAFIEERVTSDDAMPIEAVNNIVARWVTAYLEGLS